MNPRLIVTLTIIIYPPEAPLRGGGESDTQRSVERDEACTREAITISPLLSLLPSSPHGARFAHNGKERSIPLETDVPSYQPILVPFSHFFTLGLCLTS